MSKFRYIELFAGIGGFRQALDPLGGECVFASEIDKFATQSYKALYDGAPELHGDITQIDEKDVPDHDLLVGGFPCQAFSVAGKRLGFDDTRGTLFFEIARIMREKKPKIALMENVKGLVSHDKGRTLDTIVSTLNDIGYTVDFEVLNSKYFGVPQNRERIFIIAIRDDLVATESWSIGKATNVVTRGKKRISAIEGVKTFNFDWPTNNTVTTRLRDILEENVDEKYYLSEDKTAKLIEQLEKEKTKISEDSTECDAVFSASRDIINDNERQRRIYNPNGISPTMLARTDNAKIITVGMLDMKGSQQVRRVHSPNGLCPTIDTMQGGHREPKIAEHQVPKWIPKPDEINRTLRSGGKASLSDKHNYDHIAEEIRPVLTPDRTEKRQNGRRFKEDGEESFTLTAQDRHGVAIGYRDYIEQDIRDIVSKTRPNEDINVNFKENGDIRPHRMDARKSGISELNINHENNSSFTVTSSHAPKIYGESTKYRIRKLTPRECFRLQGFSDDDFDKLVAVGISNTQLYKQAGNAVTVNVIDAIGRRLLQFL